MDGNINLLQDLLGQFSFLIPLLTWIGVLRVVNKPLFSFLRAVVLATPSQRDDAWLTSIMGSKFYKTFSYVLDWVGSVKMPQKRH